MTNVPLERAKDKVESAGQAITEAAQELDEVESTGVKRLPRHNDSIGMGHQGVTRGIDMLGEDGPIRGGTTND